MRRDPLTKPVLVVLGLAIVAIYIARSLALI